MTSRSAQNDLRAAPSPCDDPASRGSEGLHNLPADLALLRRIDLGCVACLEQERFHVRSQEIARGLVAHIEAVVIDERCLVTEPLIPAALTDRREDALAELILEWRAAELRAGLTAADTLNVRHDPSFIRGLQEPSTECSARLPPTGLGVPAY